MSLEAAESRLPTRRITVVLSVASAVFLVAGFLIQLLSRFEANMYTWSHLFYLADVVTLPWWFRAQMLVFSALLLWLIGSSRAPGDPFARHWHFLAWVLVWLSLDENATIHGTLGAWVANLTLSPVLGLVAWLVPAVAFAIYVAARSRKWLQHLPPATRRGTYLATGCYLPGVVCFEILRAQELDWSGTPIFGVLSVVASGLEMAGMVIFIHTLLAYMKSFPKGVTVAVEP